jgi:predicted MFS family arabinose efflux permease
MVDVSGSARLLGLSLALSSLPLVIVGPVAGPFVDRHSARNIVLAIDGLRAVAAGVLAVLLTGALPVALTVPVLLAIALVNGCLGAIFMPAMGALVPRIVPVGAVAEANALTQSSSQMCALLGLSLGGVCYARWGAPRLLAADAVSFLAAALATLLVREPRRTDRPTSSRPDHLEELRAGWLWLRGQRPLRRLLGALAATNLLFMPVYVLLPIYTRDALGAEAWWYGALLAAASGGSLIGLASLSVKSSGPPTSGALTVVGAACGALAVASEPWMAGVLLATIGAAASRFNVVVISAIQTACPDSLRGRVMALVVAAASVATPAGLLLGAVLGGVEGAALRGTIAAAGAGIAVVGFGARDASVVPR